MSLDVDANHGYAVTVSKPLAVRHLGSGYQTWMPPVDVTHLRYEVYSGFCLCTCAVGCENVPGHSYGFVDAWVECVNIVPMPNPSELPDGPSCGEVVLGLSIELGNNHFERVDGCS